MLFSLPYPLILASTSKYRQAQLRRLGIEFSSVKPPYAENPISGLGAADLVRHHARQKALAVHALPEARNHLILAGDQAALLQTPTGLQLLGKPGSAELAVEQLLQLSGKTHELLTCVVLLEPDGQLLEREVVTQLTMRPLTAVEAAAYVSLDMPLDCAGSYKIECAGPSLFERIVGDDPTAIEGLPLISVAEMLWLACRNPA